MKNYTGVRVMQCERKTERVNKAAIVLIDQHINAIPCPTLTSGNIVAAKLKLGTLEMGIVSAYMESDKPMEPYLEEIRKVIDEIGTNHIILGGDLNAWSTWWGSSDVNHRGEELAGFLEEMNLQILNNGVDPTFDTIRGETRYTSCVDITTCSPNMLGRIENWRLNGDLTCSDHKAIMFEIMASKTNGFEIKRQTRKYNTKKAKWSEFRSKLDQTWSEKQINEEDIEKIASKEQLEQAVKAYSDSVEQACKETIPEIKSVSKVRLPWWTKELQKQKSEVATKKRRIQNAAPIRRAMVVKLYIEAKEQYEMEAKKAITSSWKEFCGKQDRESMWDGIYRVIGRTTTRKEDLPLIYHNKVLNTLESAELLTDTFYPEDKTEEDDAIHAKTREAANKVNGWQQNDPCDPPFTTQELKWAASSFNPKKAPGIDGLTADICGAAIAHNPAIFLALLNKCISLSHFPEIWKEAVVVVLRKPGKDDYTHPKAYRPIGLLPVLGKILEKMLIRRIRWHTLPTMSSQQFGFTPQRSTEDSLYVMMQQIKEGLKKKKLIVVVSLDIEGALDSAWWPAVKCRLAETNCPKNLRRLVDSYLTNRNVRLRYAGEECVRQTTKGCVQGSIGGPTYWNLLLDPLLKDLTGKGNYCQAFADDVVLIITGNTALEVQGRTNSALEHVQRWGVENKLKFAPQKTKAMVITNKLKYDSPHLSMGGQAIELSREIKILGLTIDDKLTFNNHAVNVCRKALNLYKQLSRAAKIHWGLEPEVIRTIYTAVVEPIIMYSASAWAQATNKISIQKQLNAVQRGFAQKIIKAYKTVSLNSALTIAGLLPLDMRIREAANLYATKKGYSQRVTGDWEIEKPVPFCDSPHPAELTEIKIGTVTDREQMAQHETGRLHIYTDGSKIEGRVGAALSLWDDGVETLTKKYKLEPFCTVFQAELLALLGATEKALKNKKKECSIFCDSRSALELVANGISLHPLAVKIRANLTAAKQTDRNIQLYWIKAHVGLEGNERADELAKNAALHLKTRPYYSLCPVSFAKRRIRIESIIEWGTRYKNEDTASTTKVFFPGVESYPVIRKIEFDHILVQVMTGHGGFSEYLNRFKVKESPSCVCDPEKEESILHIIAECPIYGGVRSELEIEIEQEIKLSTIASIVANKLIRNKFLNYCRSLAKKVVDRNKTR
ncbi:hypothetical protein O0L34_g14902 [Tuta absoluta]|nr:hypothetical protein O0L34_g14902 [Tuta absoluta]